MELMERNAAAQRSLRLITHLIERRSNPSINNSTINRHWMVDWWSCWGACRRPEAVGAPFRKSTQLHSTQIQLISLISLSCRSLVELFAPFSLFCLLKENCGVCLLVGGSHNRAALPAAQLLAFFNQPNTTSSLPTRQLHWKTKSFSYFASGGSPAKTKTSNPFFPFSKRRMELLLSFLCWAAVIKQLKSFNNWFHEIPSIIEVLSLFDSFNYCYNTFLFNLFIPFHEMNQSNKNESYWILICWWMNGWNGDLSRSFTPLRGLRRDGL